MDLGFRVLGFRGRGLGLRVWESCRGLFEPVTPPISAQGEVLNPKRWSHKIDGIAVKGLGVGLEDLPSSN